MQPSLKLSPSGVRGISGTTLTPEIAASFAAAFGAYLGRCRVGLATDSSPHQPMLLPAVTAGLLSVGCTPVQVGCIPTPFFQHVLQSTPVGGGIGITAGRNPAGWNTLKCYGSDGLLLLPFQFSELLDLYHQGEFARAETADIPPVEVDPEAEKRHGDAVRSPVDADRIRNRRFRVAVVGSSAGLSAHAAAFLRSLNCRVMDAGDPDEETPPDPSGPDRSALCEAVLRARADVGFALDSGGSRLCMTDEKGRYWDGESTLALAVSRRLVEQPGPVVITVATSRRIEDLAAGAGVPVVRTPVGEAHVVHRMVGCGASVGGEGNGGIILPNAHYARDGFAAMALTLDLMASDARPISTVLEGLPRYPMIKRDMPCRPRDAGAFLRLMREVYRDTLPDRTDGIRLQWSDRWMLIRASRTESLLRMVVEADTEPGAQALMDQVADYFRPAAGG